MIIALGGRTERWVMAFTLDTKKLRAGVLVGFALVFIVVLLIGLAAGLVFYIALVVAIPLGLFVGAGLGLLVGGRAAAERSR